MTVSFRVYGIPRPQGSKRAFVRGGKPILTESSGEKLKTWRGQVAEAVREHRQDPLIDGPVQLVVTFIMPRPKKPAWTWPAGRPDLSKLVRALEDELTGVVLRDDARIVSVGATKIYEWAGGPPGAMVRVALL